MTKNLSCPQFQPTETGSHGRIPAIPPSMPKHIPNILKHFMLSTDINWQLIPLTLRFYSHNCCCFSNPSIHDNKHLWHLRLRLSSSLCLATGEVNWSNACFLSTFQQEVREQPYVHLNKLAMSNNKTSQNVCPVAAFFASQSLSWGAVEYATRHSDSFW